MAMLEPLRPTIEPGPLTVAELKRVLLSLPAEQRGAIDWAIPAVEQALDRLLSAPLTDELVDECTRQVIGVLSTIGAAITAATSAQSIIHASESLIAEHLALLESRLPPETAQSAGWALRLIDAVMRVASTQPPATHSSPAQRAKPTETILRNQLAPRPGEAASHLLRAQALLYAVLRALEPEHASHHATLLRAEALADRAAEHAESFANFTRLSGLKLAIFDEEPSHLRVRLFEERARRLRAILTDEDREILRDALRRDR